MTQQADTSISVTRNISKTDEMRLETERYIIRGEADISEGTVRRISNGSVTDRESGMFLGGFEVRGGSFVGVNIQNVTARRERQAVYEAVETFVEKAAGMAAAEKDQYSPTDTSDQ